MKKAVTLSVALAAFAFAGVAMSTRSEGGAVVAAAAGDVAAIYKAKCAGCHSDDGKGKDGIGSPNFTDAKWQASRTNAQLTAMINNGKGTMPAYKGAIPAADIKALVTMVRNFGPKKAAAPAKKK